MTAGYEIVAATFTVDPSDARVVVPGYGYEYALVEMVAPTGKRWLCQAMTLVPDWSGANVVHAPRFAVNTDGTAGTVMVPLDRDVNDDPVTTTATVRVIAVDA